MSQHSRMSLAYFAAAGVWPIIVATVEKALTSPYERMVRESVCGGLSHAYGDLLGHCAVCWVGSAILMMTGLLIHMRVPNRTARSVARAR